MSSRIRGGDFDTAGQATQGLKQQLARIGVSAATMRRAMIASYEAEMNVVIHARTGTLWARVDGEKLDLEVADEGPGIPDVQLALREGWSTASDKAREMGFGAGMGLPNIRRNSDLFDIETRVGRGTRIRSTIFLGGEAKGDAPSSGADPGTETGSACAVSIDSRRCRACLRCIVACPTGALRVHAQGPAMRPGLCVGCTECFSACGSHVYGIAAAAASPAPEGAVLVLPRGLAGTDVAGTLAALSGLGFTEVRFTEEWMDALLEEAVRFAAGGARPVIPPLCPAVVALVESRFPSLIPRLGPWLSPLEAAGEEFPLRPAFLVAACPAQYSRALRQSLTSRVTVLEPTALRDALRASPRGSGLPSLRSPRAPAAPAPGELRVMGARHVLRTLAQAEAGALSGVTVLALFLCDHGCSGSPLVCADPFQAERAVRLARGLFRDAPETDAGAVARSAPYVQRPGMRLHADMASAIQALSRIDALTRSLPGRDCGACGAPTCALFAEDIVMDRADSSSCPHTTPPTSPLQEVLS